MRSPNVPDYVPIEDDRRLVRDTRSMAIINTDTDARARYRAQRQKILNDKARIDALETEVSELKGLVLKMMEKLDG